MTRAYKFLRDGAVGPFTFTPWPVPEGGAPGAWIDARSPGRDGVYACAVRDLPYWFQTELWAVELDGDVRARGHKLVASRGRLLERVAAWGAEAARGFCDACVGRLEQIAGSEPAVEGHLADARALAATGHAAVVGFVVARAAELAGGVDAYEAERAAQAAWLVERLSLAA